MIGNDTYLSFDGYVTEILVYDNVCTESQLNINRSALKTEYGLQGY